MAKSTQKLSFPGSQGGHLAARLDLPSGAPRAFALFAHCFTCSKDIFAASRVSAALAERGFAVLRFDFTGLGASDGEFANTNFSSNVADLLQAVAYLRENYEAPAVLIGHSLGGAAVLAAAASVPEAKAVATIGAPADAEHVVHNFGAKLDEIESSGVASVELAGRSFTIKKQFLDDLREQSVRERLANMKKALIVFHSPIDQTVGIENAADIFQAAKHPKSFVSLDNADHLLSRKEDAEYVAEVLSAWATRYVGAGSDESAAIASSEEGAVRAIETGRGKYQQDIYSGPHHLIADEPVSFGGLNSGLSPYDLLSAGLAACTSMTIRMYAERKKIPLEGVTVDILHDKIHAEDCADCDEKMTGRIDRFERIIELKGEIDEATRVRLIGIADRCPVHMTLSQHSVITTRQREPLPAE